jgi:hypothetical protein
MIKVEFTGLRERLMTLDRLEREQLPFAAALALTRTAQTVAGAIRDEMAVSFDRPTRATLNSPFIEPATKDKMTAKVWINDGRVSEYRQQQARLTGTAESKWGSDRSAIRWLEPQIYGGGRNHKGIERVLQRRGVIGPGQFVMPGEAAPLDQYGNIKRGQLTKILSGAKLWSEEGYNANRTDSDRSRAKRGERYFVIRRGREAIGVAERKRYGKGSRNSIAMVLVFGRSPSYTKRLDFFGVASKVANDTLPIEFEKALAQAIATRRR